jgi:para-aminobenzoate synthetase component I
MAGTEKSGPLSIRLPEFWPLFEQAAAQESHVAVFYDQGFRPDSISGLYRPPLLSMVLAWGAEKVYGGASEPNPFSQNNLTDAWLGAWSYDSGWAAAMPRNSPFELEAEGAVSFFKPRNLLYFNGTDWTFQGEARTLVQSWLKQTAWKEQALLEEKTKVKARWRFSRSAYLQKAEALLRHIQRGDIYEVNFCNCLELESELEHPFQEWKRLIAASPMPFASYLKTPQLELLSASPERFLACQGSTLFSQPMKGTRPRGKTMAEDLAAARHLETDAKERSENIMICDLVRNDLSKVAERSSVVVKDLCQVLPFKTVHQMISTVECRVRPEISLHQIWEAAFPMGSMTGAPKVRAMELIAEQEEQPRGYFSGSAAYWIPGLGFESTVLIRSLIRRAGGQWQIGVGSALTAVCNPQEEWEECQWKIAPFAQIFNLELRDNAEPV